VLSLLLRSNNGRSLDGIQAGKYMTGDSLEKLGQFELARYAIDALRRTMLHYGIWFNEVVHQLGLEEAIRLEEETFSSFLPAAVNRLSKTLGFETENSLPLWLVEMEKDSLISLIKALSLNWLTSDGMWFRTVEDNHDMYTSKRCNDTCWTRYSPLEAAMIKSFLKLPAQSGLDGLEQALSLRLYTHINEQVIEKYPFQKGPWSFFYLESPPQTVGVTGDHSLKWTKN
jgi:hypothetical protein